MPKQIKKRIPKKSSDTEEDVKDKLATFVDTIKYRQKRFISYVIVGLVIIIAVIGARVVPATRPPIATKA